MPSQYRPPILSGVWYNPDCRLSRSTIVSPLNYKTSAAPLSFGNLSRRSKGRDAVPPTPRQMPLSLKFAYKRPDESRLRPAPGHSSDRSQRHPIDVDRRARPERRPPLRRILHRQHPQPEAAPRRLPGPRNSSTGPTKPGLASSTLHTSASGNMRVDPNLGFEIRTVRSAVQNGWRAFMSFFCRSVRHYYYDPSSRPQKQR